jgi:hypothetical protein
MSQSFEEFTNVEIDEEIIGEYVEESIDPIRLKWATIITTVVISGFVLIVLLLFGSALGQ